MTKKETIWTNCWYLFVFLCNFKDNVTQSAARIIASKP